MDIIDGFTVEIRRFTSLHHYSSINSQKLSKDIIHLLEMITEILSFLQIFSMRNNQPLSFFNILETLPECHQKSYISEIFCAFKSKLQIICAATYSLYLHFTLHCFFLTLIIVIRNGKTVRKHGPYCSYFHLKYMGWPYRWYIRTVKYGDIREELFSEMILVTSCCYGLGAMASETVLKIARDEKVYRKCSTCVIICWIAKIYLSITNCEKRLVPRTPST